VIANHRGGSGILVTVTTLDLSVTNANMRSITISITQERTYSCVNCYDIAVTYFHNNSLTLPIGILNSQFIGEDMIVNCEWL